MPDADKVIDFRCDAGRVETDPNRSHCTGRVIVRRPDVLLCCDTMVGDADKDWQWKSMTCSGNVRVQHGSEWVWAKKAVFNPTSSAITLTGDPVVQRGRSVIAGDVVTVLIERDQAMVERPIGRVQNAQTEVRPLPEFTRISPLPEKCPLPAGPKL